MRMVTINLCGSLVQLVWLNGALVRLSELQSLIESQKQSREAKIPASTASAKGTTAGNVAAWRE